MEYADPSMAIYRVINTDHEWGLSQQLLAGILDFHVLKAWMEGGKKGKKPKAIPRPGVTEKETTRVKPKQAMSVTDMDAWLASRQRGQITA